MIQPSTSGSELRVVDTRGDELVRALTSFALCLPELAVDGLVAHRRLDDLTAADERLELAVGDLPTRGCEEPRLENREDHQQSEDVPDGEGRS